MAPRTYRRTAAATLATLALIATLALVQTCTDFGHHDATTADLSTLLLSFGATSQRRRLECVHPPPSHARGPDYGVGVVGFPQRRHCVRADPVPDLRRPRDRGDWVAGLPLLQPRPVSRRTCTAGHCVRTGTQRRTRWLGVRTVFPRALGFVAGVGLVTLMIVH